MFNDKRIKMILKKEALLLWLLGLFFGVARGQNIELDGYMGVQGGESFNYHLDLQPIGENNFEGYSLTYKNDKAAAVKVFVKAKVNKNDKTLEIQEQEIINNSGFQSKAVICLVHAILKWQEQENVLSGSLITQTSNNGATCSTGSISLIQKKQVDKLFDEAVSEKDNPADLSQNAQPDNPPKVNPEQKLKAHFEQLKRQEEQRKRQAALVTNREKQSVDTDEKATTAITEGKEAYFEWHSDKILLEIWDGGEIDNDRVTVSLNGKEILVHYVLTAKPMALTFPIKTGELNVLSIKADNEGANPPNTANILLKDGEESYSVLAHNKIGKVSLIKIKRVK